MHVPSSTILGFIKERLLLHVVVPWLETMIFPPSSSSCKYLGRSRSVLNGPPVLASVAPLPPLLERGRGERKEREEREKREGRKRGEREEREEREREAREERERKEREEREERERGKRGKRTGRQIRALGPLQNVPESPLEVKHLTKSCSFVVNPNAKTEEYP